MEDIHDIEEMFPQQQRFPSGKNALEYPAVINNFSRKPFPIIRPHFSSSDNIAVTRTVITMGAVEITVSGKFKLQRNRIRIIKRIRLRFLKAFYIVILCINSF